MSLLPGPEGTIYAEEQGFDADLRIEIDPIKIDFIALLKTSNASSIFHVRYDGDDRVLKVVFSTMIKNNDKDPGYADDGVRDLNRARSEIRAYCRLKTSGVCDAGYVPQFYGYALSLDSDAYTPHLGVFKKDVGLPSAVLIEYLPKPLMMDCVTYTPERMDRAIEGIKRVHEALVGHNDPYPKNIVIVPGSPERVMWIDFDVAITYPDSSYVGERERVWIELERQRVECFGKLLAEDQRRGLPPNTIYY